MSRAVALLAKSERMEKKTTREITYLYVDARYEKVLEGGKVHNASILVAMVISLEGRRQVSGVSISLSKHKTQRRIF